MNFQEHAEAEVLMQYTYLSRLNLCCPKITAAIIYVV